MAEWSFDSVLAFKSKNALSSFMQLSLEYRKTKDRSIVRNIVFTLLCLILMNINHEILLLTVIEQNKEGAAEVTYCIERIVWMYNLYCIIYTNIYSTFDLIEDQNIFIFQGVLA